jgi:hypothetical protein
MGRLFTLLLLAAALAAQAPEPHRLTIPPAAQASSRFDATAATNA